MYRDIFCLFRNKITNILIRILYHEMHIKRHLCPAAKALHHRCTIADIRYKMSVHDIYMDQMRSGILDLFHIFSQTRKICG